MDQEDLDHTIARDIMTPEVFMLPVEASLREVVDLMSDKQVSACFFENEKDGNYYIITHTDMINFLYAKGNSKYRLEDIPASEIIQGPVKMIDQSISIDQAIHFLKKHHFKRTLVCSGSKAIGVLSIMDLLEWNNKYFRAGKPQVLLFIDNESGVMIGKHFFTQNLDVDVDKDLVELFGGALRSIEHITNEVMGMKNEMKNLVGEKHAILFEVFFDITGILVCDRKSLELHQKLHSAVRAFYSQYQEDIASSKLKHEYDVSKVAEIFEN